MYKVFFNGIHIFCSFETFYQRVATFKHRRTSLRSLRSIVFLVPKVCKIETYCFTALMLLTFNTLSMI